MTRGRAEQGLVSGATSSFTRETSRSGAPFSRPVDAIGLQGLFRQSRLQNCLGAAAPPGMPFPFEEEV